MSKASEYHEAMSHPQPSFTIGEHWHGKSAFVDERGNLVISESRHSPGGVLTSVEPQQTKIVICSEEVPALIKWLKETFEG